MEVQQMSVEEFPLIKNIKMTKKIEKDPVVYFPSPDGKQIRKEKYAGLTPKERENAYKRTYYQKNGRQYHLIRSRCKRYDMVKDDFKDCKTPTDIDNRVDEVLKTRGYPDSIIKTLTCFRKKNKKYDDQ